MKIERTGCLKTVGFTTERDLLAGRIVVAIERGCDLELTVTPEQVAYLAERIRTGRSLRVTIDFEPSEATDGTAPERMP